MIYYILGAIAIAWVGGWVLNNIYEAWELIVGMLLIVAAVLTAGYGLSHSDWVKQSWIDAETRDAADAQPRVVREIDGCKVYAFKAGGYWHYFTKCPTTVTTESTYRSGKTTKTEIIETQR